MAWVIFASLLEERRKRFFQANPHFYELQVLIKFGIKLLLFLALYIELSTCYSWQMKLYTLTTKFHILTMSSRHLIIILISLGNYHVTLSIWLWNLHFYYNFQTLNNNCHFIGNCLVILTKKFHTLTINFVHFIRTVISLLHCLFTKEPSCHFEYEVLHCNYKF